MEFQGFPFIDISAAEGSSEPSPFALAAHSHAHVLIYLLVRSGREDDIQANALNTWALRFSFPRADFLHM
jgi:hypothetical protein